MSVKHYFEHKSLLLTSSLWSSVCSSDCTGVTAEDILSHNIAQSVFLTAGLSPKALFFPDTHLEHFLKCIKREPCNPWPNHLLFTQAISALQVCPKEYDHTNNDGSLNEIGIVICMSTINHWSETGQLIFAPLVEAAFEFATAGWETLTGWSVCWGADSASKWPSAGKGAPSSLLKCEGYINSTICKPVVDKTVVNCLITVKTSSWVLYSSKDTFSEIYRMKSISSWKWLSLRCGHQKMVTHTREILVVYSTSKILTIAFKNSCLVARFSRVRMYHLWSRATGDGWRRYPIQHKPRKQKGYLISEEHTLYTTFTFKLLVFKGRPSSFEISSV